MTTTQTSVATQIHRIWIKATPQAVWDAITQPEWTVRYGYGGYAHYDLRTGGQYYVNPDAEFRAGAEARGAVLPDVIIEGEVLEVDPPHRLVTTFHMLMDPAIASEPSTRITHEIKDLGNGTCSLTVTHELEGAPKLAFILGGAGEDFGAGGGHAWVLSDLKTLLETGRTMAATG
jgi:uncharacterized protein YndB with AHSA1/START domain